MAENHFGAKGPPLGSALPCAAGNASPKQAQSSIKRNVSHAIKTLSNTTLMILSE